MINNEILNVNIYLFDGFETLDIFGPIEVLARVENFKVDYFSINGGIVTSAQNLQIVTKSIEDANENGIFVIPGGRGTRPLVQNDIEKKLIRKYVDKAMYCLSICTGSAVLASCGVLDGKKVTSNKKAFEWVASCNNKVNWQREARWCVDDKFYTSSGVSAGIDMALGFVRDLLDEEKAMKIAEDMEYIWNKNEDKDPFAWRKV